MKKALDHVPSTRRAPPWNCSEVVVLAAWLVEAIDFVSGVDEVVLDVISAEGSGGLVGSGTPDGQCQ